MSKILIKNVRIPLYHEKTVRSADILFSEAKGDQKGEILEIAPRIEVKNARIIDGEGDYILPGFADLCADIYRDPKAETIESGSLSAKWGGFSDITVPVPQSKEEAFLKEAKASAHCRISCGSLIEKHSEIKDQGFCFVDADKDISIRELRDMMLCASKNDTLLILSPKKDPAYPDSCITECRTASLMGLPCEPVSVETRCIAQYLILAEETGCRIHIRSLSAKKSVELIRRAKACGIRVSASTSPHYFALTCKDMIFIGSNAKVYPPLREEEDRMAVIEGLCDGSIDCIDSGHTPRSKAEKGPSIRDAMFGACGLQSTFSAALTYLLLPGYIDIFKLCELLSYAPRRILGMEEGYIDKGCDALELASVSNEFIFSEGFLKSKSTNSPFINMSLCGNIRENFI